MSVKQEFSDLVRAMARADWPELDRLLAVIDKMGWQGSAPVFGAAFASMVHRRFQPDQDVRDITRSVAEVRGRYQDGSALPALEMEAMIRAALGEVDLADNVAPETAFDVQLAVLTTLLHDADLIAQEFDSYIAEVGEMARHHL